MGRQIRNLQTNFVAGECDPKLRARSDIKQYYQGLKYARNVLVIPQGGTRRRPGLEFVERLAIAPLRAKFITFTFSTEQRYLMLVRGGKLSVYKNGVFQVDIPIPHTEDQIRELTFTQSLDTLLLFHPDVQSQKVQRAGSDILWNIAGIVFSNIPTFPFEFTTTTTGDPAAATGTGINFVSGVAMFSVGDVGKAIRGNGGYAIITGFTNATTVVVDIKTNFLNANAIAAGSWTLEEAVWSASRGWPTCGTFHQGRLLLGGSRQRPQTLWGSRSGLYFDFDSTSTLDDYGFESTADSDTVSAIQQLYSGRHLLVFTNDSEWYIPVDQDPLVPKNQWMKRATKRGSEFKEETTGLLRRVPVVEVDGGILYIQSGGKAVREFLWDDPEQDYGSQNISLLSSHLLNNPVDFAIRKSTNTEEADYALIVNGDGTLTVLCTLRDQNITAWTQCSTKGNFKAVGIDGETIYFMVERTIAGVTNWYMERFNNALVLDCARFTTSGVPASIFGGFDHLNGETSKVRVDGANIADQAPVGGSITLEDQATISLEVGLDFPSITVPDRRGKRSTVTVRTPFVRSLPVAPQLPDGTRVGKKKRAIEVTLQLQDTQLISVNSQPLVVRQFDVDNFDEAPPMFTGDYTVEGLLGYDELGQLDFSQDEPGPWFLLGFAADFAL